MTKLSYQQIEALWIRNGGSKARAPIMAAIALAESGGHTDSWNKNPPDDSVGLWQINYYGDLRPGRTAAFGPRDELIKNPDKQARAAIQLSNNGERLTPWSVYLTGAYRQYLDPSAAPDDTLPPFDTSPLPGGTSTDPGAVPVSASDNDCLINLPHIGCLLSKGQAYAVLGALELIGGTILMLTGITLLLVKTDVLKSAPNVMAPFVDAASRRSEAEAATEKAKAQQTRSRAQIERSRAQQAKAQAAQAQTAVPDDSDVV